jgi:hypothetical protein
VNNITLGDKTKIKAIVFVAGICQKGQIYLISSESIKDSKNTLKINPN